MRHSRRRAGEQAARLFPFPDAKADPVAGPLWGTKPQEICGKNQGESLGTIAVSKDFAWPVTKEERHV